jgi:PPP family 3-phenylpropionic acid transporter
MPPGRGGVILRAPMPRLSGFWFAYMAGLGLVFPYQALYLSENGGLSGTELGLVLAVRPLMGILFQPAWGWLSDRTGSRARILAGIGLGNALAYAFVPEAVGFAALAAAIGLVACFGTSMVPMGTSLSMAALGDRASDDFGRVRMWGTVGFAAMVVALPWMLDGWQQARGLIATADGPSEPGLGIIFRAAAVLTLVAAALALRIRTAAGGSARARRGDLRILAHSSAYRRGVLFVFGSFLLLQGPISLFPVFITDRGGSLDTLSLMWIPMLALEVPLVRYAGVGLRRLGARGLLVVGVLADGLRWLGCALAPSLGFVFGLQLLHGVVIAGLIIGMSLSVEQVVPDRLRSSGQGFMAMAVSLAGMVSVAATGWLTDHLGITATYVAAGAASVALALSALGWLPQPGPRKTREAESVG